MRRCCLLLFTIPVLVVAILMSGSTSTTLTAPTDDINEVSLLSGSINCVRKRSLQPESNTIERTEVSSTNDEERISMMGANDAVKKMMEALRGAKDTLKLAKDAIVWLWNAVKIRLKMKFWLYRRTTPEEVSMKLKVTRKTDKTDMNYRYYARYYFRYYVKYPSKIPKDLPKKGVDNIMKARMYDWINKNRSPAQVFNELGFTGTFESARGKPYYEYFERYFKKWRDLQIRLSKPPPKLQINLEKTSHEVMMTRLENWLRSTYTPAQVFKELGFTGTFASARGKPNYEYFELYSKMWSALQTRLSRPPPKLQKTTHEAMMARLEKWLRSTYTPAQVFKELGFTGTFASARGKPNYEYFELYSKMWRVLQSRLSQDI